MTGNRWLQIIEENPGHSEWYIERFRTMAADGADLHGEARLVDAMVGRASTILDAGCGPGRVGGELARRGHRVVGVDIDPVLIAAAAADHPGSTWLVGDLATLDRDALRAAGDLGDGFDVIVCAGNVMTFLDPSTRGAVLRRLGGLLTPSGRLVVGFGAARGYTFDEFFEDAAAAGLSVSLRLATWDLRPLGDDGDFLVAVLER